MKRWYGRFTRQKYLVRTSFFMCPHFFSGYGPELRRIICLTRIIQRIMGPSHTDKPSLLWIRPRKITSGVWSSSNVTMPWPWKKAQFSSDWSDHLEATKRHFTNSFFGPEELTASCLIKRELIFSWSNIMIDHYDILLLLSTELRSATIDWPSTIFHISYFITHE